MTIARPALKESPDFTDFWTTTLLLLWYFSLLFIQTPSLNNLLSLSISIAMLLGPEFIGRFMPTYTLTKIFAELNIENLIGPISMFGNISTYNIFGKPVLYLNVIVTIGIISIPIVLYFINRIGKKQVV